MSLEHAINVRFRTNLQEISSLEYINAVVLLKHAMLGFYTHGMLTKFLDEQLGRLWGCRSWGKVIHLSTDQDILSIGGASVDILLMCGVTESHLVDKDIRDHPFL